MRNLRIADPDFEARVCSPLGDRLIQLDTEIEVKSVDQLPTERSSWQEQWSSGNEQISSRLALIEAELDRLAESRSLNVNVDIHRIAAQTVRSRCQQEQLLQADAAREPIVSRL